MDDKPKLKPQVAPQADQAAADHLLQSQVASMVKPVIKAGQEEAKREAEQLQHLQQARFQVEQQHRNALDDLIAGMGWALVIGVGLGALTGWAKGGRRRDDGRR